MSSLNVNQLISDLAHSSERPIRDAALETLANHIHEIEPDVFTYRRIWRGIWFLMWHADKPLYQRALAEHISRLLHRIPLAFANPAAFANYRHGATPRTLWLAAQFRTMSTLWCNTDRFRLDKYLYLIRQTVNACLVAWEPSYAPLLVDAFILAEPPQAPTFPQLASAAAIKILKQHDPTAAARLVRQYGSAEAAAAAVTSAPASQGLPAYVNVSDHEDNDDAKGTKAKPSKAAKAAKADDSDDDDAAVAVAAPRKRAAARKGAAAAEPPAKAPAASKKPTTTAAAAIVDRTAGIGAYPASAYDGCDPTVMLSRAAPKVATGIPLQLADVLLEEFDKLVAAAASDASADGSDCDKAASGSDDGSDDEDAKAALEGKNLPEWDQRRRALALKRVKARKLEIRSANSREAGRLRRQAINLRQRRAAPMGVVAEVTSGAVAPVEVTVQMLRALEELTATNDGLQGFAGSAIMWDVIVPVLVHSCQRNVRARIDLRIMQMAAKRVRDAARKDACAMPAADAFAKRLRDIALSDSTPTWNRRLIVNASSLATAYDAPMDANDDDDVDLLKLDGGKMMRRGMHQSDAAVSKAGGKREAVTAMAVAEKRRLQIVKKRKLDKKRVVVQAMKEARAKRKEEGKRNRKRKIKVLGPRSNFGKGARAGKPRSQKK